MHSTKKFFKEKHNQSNPPKIHISCEYQTPYSNFVYHFEGRNDVPFFQRKVSKDMCIFDDNYKSTKINDFGY